MRNFIAILLLVTAAGCARTRPAAIPSVDMSGIASIAWSKKHGTAIGPRLAVSCHHNTPAPGETLKWPDGTERVVTRVVQCSMTNRFGVLELQDFTAVTWDDALPASVTLYPILTRSDLLNQVLTSIVWDQPTNTLYPTPMYVMLDFGDSYYHAGGYWPGCSSLPAFWTGRGKQWVTGLHSMQNMDVPVWVFMNEIETWLAQ